MTWRNWAGTVTATSQSTARPRDAQEAAALIGRASEDGYAVRPLGSGHSFTGIGAPEPGTLALDLSTWTGITHADPDSGLVIVRAGTTLARLNVELHELGLAMANLGDIDQQTIAGAISTGTHGTGAGLGGLATQVEELELITSEGAIRRCSRTENPDLFDAARVGLGALGVISTVTLRCVPAFALAAEEKPERLSAVLERFDELAEHNEHFEFYWFPHSERTLVKCNNRLPLAAETRPLHPLRNFLEYQVMENYAFGGLCRLGRAVPSLVRPLNRLSGTAWSARSYSDSSYRVFVTPRSVRFVECEYAIPRASLPDVLGQLRAAVARLEHPVMFPVEVRVAAADDVWMSTAYQRETAYIAIHQYVGMPYRLWFDTFQAIADAVGGRPHWGKMHQLDAAKLRTRYPRFDDFRRLRAEVDPAGTFRNSYLDRVLGP